MRYDDQIRRNALGVRMVGFGFKNAIIEIATGLTVAKIKLIRVDLNADDNGTKRGCLKQPNRIVNNRRRMIDGSILIQAYLMMAPGADRQIDWDALMSAYTFYLDMHKTIYTHCHNELDINEAFVLVRDYRCKNGNIELKSCSCGCDYIVVSEQRMRADCPVCNLESKDTKNSETEEKAELENISEMMMDYDD